MISARLLIAAAHTSDKAAAKKHGICYLPRRPFHTLATRFHVGHSLDTTGPDRVSFSLLSRATTPGQLITCYSI